VEGMLSTVEAYKDVCAWNQLWLIGFAGWFNHARRMISGPAKLGCRSYCMVASDQHLSRRVLARRRTLGDDGFLPRRLKGATVR